MKIDSKQSNNNVHKVIKNNKKRVHFSKDLNKTFTYVKSIEEERHENKANEFSCLQKELYKKEINRYLISEVEKQKPDYHFILDEFDIKGNLFLFEKKNILYMVFFHDGELQFKIISFNINLKITNSFLDLFFKDKLDELITAFNNIDEYFHFNVLVDKIK